MNRIRRSISMVAGAALLTLGLPCASLAQATATPPTYARAAEYDVVVSKNVMVPMRDGAEMATDVYLPVTDGAPGAGPFPVLLSRTPYGKDGSAADGQFFAERGYAVAIQDVRGRYDSEGTYYIYVNEGKDGYDAVEWAARQPWSNGSVGTFGGSYLAATQNALAVENPPSLKGMFVVVGTSNYFEDGMARGGAFYLLHNVAYAFNLSVNSQEAAADPPRQAALRQDWVDNMGQWMEAYPYRRNASPFALFPVYDRWFQDWIDHSSYDDYWRQNGYTFERYYDKYPDIPIYFVGGWYDIFLRGTLTNYAGLSATHTATTKLMVGAWEHGVGPRATGDVDFGESAGVDVRAEQLRWYDQVLMGQDTDVFDEPPVRVFMMGGGTGRDDFDGEMQHGGEWRFVSGWPTPGATPTNFYLQADGGLDEDMPGAAEPTHYVFDPRNPVPTIGGQIDSGKQLVPAGPFDQRCTPQVFGCEDSLPLSARDDVVVFQTPPLDRAVEVSGPITVKLWVSSSTPDTDFTAKLIDVHPPNADHPWGYAMNLADRIVRGRYRNSLERAEPMTPGEVHEVTIDLLGTSNRFEAGHRIRLDVSSSNFPFFDVNPNTGATLGRSFTMEIATNSIYHDREHPSHVTLPILPASTTTSAPASR